MLQSPHPAFNAVTFIGAGLAMVAHGASAAVGLAEPSEETEGARARPAESPPGADPGQELAQCLGRRLEVRLHQGC